MNIVTQIINLRFTLRGVIIKRLIIVLLSALLCKIVYAKIMEFRADCISAFPGMNSQNKLYLSTVDRYERGHMDTLIA